MTGLNMKAISMKLITGFAAACATVLSVASAQTVAIMDGRVHTVSGGVIENGDVIIRDGRIAQIGADLTAPQGATVIDATGKVVTPGFFAPYSNIGLVEIGAVSESNDSRAGEGFPLGAALNVVDAFNPSSVLIPVNRAGGITRAVSAPNAGEYLDEARSYQANPNDYVRRPHDGRFAVSDLKALGPVISGEQPLIVEINGANDIRTLIRLKNTYRLRVIIAGGSEAWRVAGDLAAANIPVITSGMDNLPSQFEEIDTTLKNAARLNRAGVKIGFYEGAHSLTLTRQHAGNAVAEGLPFDAALKALTLWPAEMFGLAQDLGSLDVGKVADVVIWDGDPLEVTSVPEAVFIAGRPQDLENRQHMLMERYRDLSRGDLPLAYRGGE